MSHSGANSSQVVSKGQRSTASVPHTSIVLLVALVIGAFVIGGLGTFAFMRARTPHANAAAPVSSSRVMAAVIEAKTAEPVGVPVASLPTKAPSNMTVVSFPRSRIVHRVWVDDVFVGSTGASINVRCGRRSIKIGSQGKPRDVDLPCGGETSLR